MNNNSLVNKVFTSSTLLIVLTLLVIFTANYWRAASKAENAHRNKLQTQLDLLSQSLEGPVWSLDTETANLIGEAFVAGTDVVSLQIYFQHSNEAVYSQESQDQANILYGEKLILHEDQAIGRIRIGVSGSAYAEELHNLLISSILIVLILALFLITTIRFLLKKFLEIPLEGLGLWAETVATGDYDASPPEINLGELRRLADRFSLMAGKIQNRERSLIASENKFRGLFENSEVSIWHEDISGVVRALEELRQAGITDLRSHLRGNEELVWELAAKVRVVDVNEATLRLFGARDKPQMLGKIYETFGPNASETFVENLCALWENRKEFRAEAPFKSLDGRDITAIITFNIPRSPDDCQNVPVCIIDITDLKRAEEELHNSETMFRDFFQANPMATIISSPDGMIHMVNPAFTEVTGFKYDEVVGRTAQEMNFWRDPKGRETMVEGIRERGYAQIESTFWGKSERPMTCIVSSRAIMHKGEMRIINIVHDITEIREAEQELIKYRNHLEQLVEEKTAELKLAHNELVQQERLATLGKLSATISHEILNPLGTIQNAIFSLSMYLEDNDPQKSAKALDIASRNIDRCVKIIEDINGFARVRELVLVPTTLSDWLAEIIEEMELPDEIECTFDFPAPLQVKVDADKLRQVIVNLVNNAVHALQEEQSCGKRIRLSTLSSGDRYEIRVEDNGIGMSEDVQDHVFEPLYSTKGFGVGLGMFIVKNIVQQHHGSIDIESTEGVGTCITLSLPIDMARDSAA